MLMDFQIDSSHEATAEILAEAPTIVHIRNFPAHEIRTFDLSGSVWKAMFACYAVFFGALIFATAHSTAAIFALVVSIGYTAVYFGAATILNRVSAPERATLPKGISDAGIETNTGWMSNTAVNAQILMVPVSLAIFACSFALSRALV